MKSYLSALARVVLLLSVSACALPARVAEHSATNPAQARCPTCGDGATENRAAMDTRKIYPAMWHDPQNCSVEKTLDPRAQALIATFSAMDSTAYLNREKAEECKAMGRGYEANSKCAADYVPVPPGWDYVDEHASQNGLYMEIYQRKDRAYGKPITVFAIRGTQTLSPLDWWNDIQAALWGIPPQYKEARATVEKWLATNRRGLPKGCGEDMDLYVTGHSLGGAIAQYIAYGHPCMTAVTFNSIGGTEYKNVDEYQNPAVCRLAESYEPARVFTGVAVPPESSRSLHSCGYVNVQEASKLFSSHKMKGLSETALCRALASGAIPAGHKEALRPGVCGANEEEIDHLSGVWCR